MKKVLTVACAALALLAPAAPYQDSPGVEKTRRGELKSSDSVVTDVSFRQMAEPFLGRPLVEGGRTNMVAQVADVAAAAASKQDALSPAQTNALDSGVTADRVAEWDALKASKQDALSPAQSNAVNSGVTAAGVARWDGYDASKQDRLTAPQMLAVNSGVDAGRVTNYDYVVSHFREKQDALTDPQLRAVNSGVTSNDVRELRNVMSNVTHVIGQEVRGLVGDPDALARWDATTTKWSDKQDALTAAQTNAVNSGVTSSKVGGYDAHVADGDIHVTSSQKAAWSAKQDALTAAQTNAVDSGITSSKRSGYDTHVANGDIHVTAAQKTAWSAKQAALSAAQTNAVDSGITSGKVSSYDSHLSDSGIHVTASQKTAWNGYGTLIGTLQATKVDASDVYTKGEIELVVLRNLVMANITNHLANLTWDDSYNVMWKKRADAGCFFETAYTNVNVLVEGNP